MKEWITVCDQPHYGSKISCNSGSGSSGSKRAHEIESSDSNSVGSNGERCIKEKKRKRKVRAQPWKWSTKILMSSEKSRLKSSNTWKISHVARGGKLNVKRGNPKARGGKPIDERKNSG